MLAVYVSMIRCSLCTDVLYMQAFSGSSHVQGLQDFFDAPRKEKEEVTAGQLLIVD